MLTLSSPAARRIMEAGKRHEARDEPPQPEAVAPAAPVVEELPPLAGPLTVRTIQDEVCRHYGVRHIDLISQRRTRNVFLPRHVSAWLCCRLTPLSQTSIGRLHGDRTCATIGHSRRVIERLIAAGDPAALDMAAIADRLPDWEEGR